MLANRHPGPFRLITADNQGTPAVASSDLVSHAILARQVLLSFPVNTKSGRFCRPALHTTYPVPTTLQQGPAATPAAGPSLFVKAAATGAGLSQTAHYRLRLAVEELATNVILYGCSPAEGGLELRSELDETTLTVILEDRGIPFDPSKFPPPDDLGLPAKQRKLEGLGIFLARQSVDRYA
jgi:serine/threonine-protein kinase RsbW